MITYCFKRKTQPNSKQSEDNYQFEGGTEMV